MSEARDFKIHEDSQEAMVKLIEAVPSDWSWIDGSLEAPRQDGERGLTAWGLQLPRA